MHIRTLLLVSALCAGGTLSVHAADNATAAAAPASSSGVMLASLCDNCAVVDSVKSETRKGKASGVGAVGGAVVGGVIGHQLGGGTGKKVATVGGAVAGGLAGNEIEKRAKKYTVWVTHVTMKNGSKHTYEQSAAPAFKKGDVVHVDGKTLTKK